jgi:hypothetical protein
MKDTESQAHYRMLHNRLTTILGCCEMLEAEDEKNKNSQYLRMAIQTAVETLRELQQQFLDDPEYKRLDQTIQ